MLYYGLFFSCDGFDCFSLIKYEDDCVEFVKGPSDVDCEIPCYTDNCTSLHLGPLEDCIIVQCFPKPPAPTPIPPRPIPPAHSTTVMVTVVLLPFICFVIIVLVCWKYSCRRQPRQAFIDEPPTETQQPSENPDSIEDTMSVATQSYYINESWHPPTSAPAASSQSNEPEEDPIYEEVEHGLEAGSYLIYLRTCFYNFNFLVLKNICVG